MILFVDTLPIARVEAADGVSCRRWDDGPSGWVVDPAKARSGEHVRLDTADEATISGLRIRGVIPWLTCPTPAAVERASELGIGAWLRGSEVGGPVDVHPITALIRVAARLRVAWVADGLGIRGMAAAVAIGASGVCFSPMPVSGVARDTVVLGELCDRRYRALFQPGLAFRELERLGRSGDAHALERAWDAATDRWWDRWDAVIPAAEAVAVAGRDPASVRAEVLALAAEMRQSRAMEADPLGTGRPVVQGPMANVAERADLAAAVASAGGMPFFALGSLDAGRAAAVLDGIAGRWGVGIIALDPGVLARQLPLVLASDAAVVTLWGGTVALAAEIQRHKPVWMHTPSAGLGRRAMEAGVAGLIFEGADAGGHVGFLSSVALWEEGLAAVEAWIDEGRTPPLVVLAGGIGDAPSAALAFAMAAGVTRRGGRVVVQAGTAFLLTHDAAEGRQVTGSFQRAAVGCTRTVLVGSSARFPLRVASNSWAAAERQAEIGGPGSIGARRAAFERGKLGRTRIAARGIERDPSGAARYREVPAARQLAEGAFALGSGAAVTRELSTAADVVEALSGGAGRWIAENRERTGVRTVAGAPRVAVPADEAASVQLGPAADAPNRAESQRGTPLPAPSSQRSAFDRANSMAVAEPIAIIGLGCVMPRAFDVPAFWANLVRGVDAVGPIPRDRWDPALYHDPNATANGAELTRSAVAGAVVGFELDPLAFRIPPKVFASMDPAQRMALAAAAQAVEGLDIDPEKAAVILGNAMGGEFVKSLAVRVRSREVLAMLREDPALREVDDWAAVTARLSDRLGERLPPMNANSMAGLLSNVVAGRVAAWLDWRGGAFTVDAACASALASIAVAVDWLRNGRCDYVLAGGVDGDLSAETFVGFSLAGALSSGGSRPFAEKADGFVMGEGAGVVLLERLSDAVARNHPIYAVIRGVGESSDGRGRGVTAPHPDGQRRALSRAFSDAALSPSDVGLVEAHGTGTAIGDATETEVLRSIYQDCPPQSVWLGSVKSMLGHLKSAAGAAGTLKAVLSTALGVVPPTLHAGPVDPGLSLRESAFKLPKSAVRWDGHRVAAVSAFGFGGTNFHLLLEQAPASAPKPACWDQLAREAALVQSGDAWELPESTAPRPVSVARPKTDARVSLWLFAADDRDGLVRALERPSTDPGIEGACRLAVLVPTGGEADALADARAAVAGTPGRRAFLGDGVASLGFVYPGQGSQRIGAVAAVRAFEAGARVLDELESHLGRPFAALERASDGELTTDTRAVHRLMYGLGLAWDAVLREAGIRPSVRLGHSLGEFPALVAAGRMDPIDGLRAVIARGDALYAASPGRMLAVEGDEAPVLALCGPEVWIAAHNGPTSWVLSAVGEGARHVTGEARRRGLKTAELAVSRPFHAPVLGAAAAALAAALGPLGPGGLVLSGVDGEELDASRLVAAVTHPVRFWEATRRPVQWVEVGPGTALSRHIDGIPLDPNGALGTLTAAARLWAAGHPGLLRRVHEMGLAGRAKWSGNGRAIPKPKINGHDAVSEAVYAAIGEVTGYPRSFLDQGGDLEADLGVDSIRKLEILGGIEQRLGIAADPSDTARLAGLDVAGLVSWAREKAAVKPVNGVYHNGSPPIRNGTGPEMEPVRLYQRVWIPAPVVGLGASRRVAVPGPGIVRSEGRWWVRLDASDGGVPERSSWLVAALIVAFRGAEPAPLVAWLSDDPAQAAVSGFVRSLAREWNTGVTVVRGRDLPAASWPAVLDLGPRPLWWRGGGLLVGWPTRVEPDLPALNRPVVLAAGNTDGILGPCLAALGGVGIVVSRRRPSEIPEGFAWIGGDARDPVVVAAAAAAARKHGPIDIVIHAAGVLSDRRVPSIGDEAADVLGAKLDVAAALMAETAADRPKYWVAFTSLAGHEGNAGQAVYAAANAVLDGWEHPTAARSTAIAWSAWSDVGMARSPAIQAAMSLAGIRAITPPAGAAAFRRALAVGPVIAAAQDFPAPPTDRLLRLGNGILEARTKIEPNPRFLDHAPAGRPIVPFAWWTTMATDLAGMVGAECDLVDAEVHAVAPVADGWTPTVRIADGTIRIDHGDVRLFSARLGTVAASGGRTVPNGKWVDAGRFYRPELLFHGESWRLLGRVSADGSAALVPWRETLDEAGLADAIWQLLAVREHLAGRVPGLPMGAKSWSHRASPRGDVTIVLDGDDAVAMDADGTPVLEAKGLRTHGIARG